MELGGDQDRALKSLNPTERDLLSLLGRGHTAKSIADLRSLSEAAVNERFRSARRKTGIGSSREIARLIVAQENRDDFIDLAEPAVSPPNLPRPDPHHRASPSRRWRLPMAAAFLLAAAILAQQTYVPPGNPAVPPAAAAIFAPRAPSPDIVALHNEVSAGSSDPVWSSATETSLSRSYHALTSYAEAVESLSVSCNATLCEVIGVSRPDVSASASDRLADEIKGRDIADEAARLKLGLVARSLYSTKDDSSEANPTPTVFVDYWRRAENP
jgi:DNA-binding CsgD family transcriptional regulator